MKPTVGRIVHYVSHGTPVRADGTQAYGSECRAAIITEVPSGPPSGSESEVGLAVLNPDGIFLKRGVRHVDHDAGDGGTWHWPEREA